MGTEESAGAIVPGREGRNFLVRGDRLDDSVRVEPREGMTDQLSLFGERGPRCAPWEAGEAGSGMCAHRGAASIIGVGEESGPGDGHPDGEDL